MKKEEVAKQLAEQGPVFFGNNAPPTPINEVPTSQLGQQSQAIDPAYFQPGKIYRSQESYRIKRIIRVISETFYDDGSITKEDRTLNPLSN